MRYRYDKDKDEYVEDEWQGTILEACEWLVLALKEESAKEKDVARHDALEMLVSDIEYRIGSGENYLI
jgi:hypothetical protein